MSRHTPGPWLLSLGHGDPWGTSEIEAEALGVRSFGGDFGRVAIVESSAADASLIAAAPALLAALQGLLDPATNEDSVWYSEARQAARAAIARALGEAA